MVEEGESCALEGGRESSVVGEPAASGTQTQTHLWSYGLYLFWGFLFGGFFNLVGWRVEGGGR